MTVTPDLEKLCVRLGEQDNVLTALQDVVPGEYHLNGRRFAVQEFIPAGFKVATEAIAAGQKIIKYNSPIGVATVDIPAGTLVHVHNLISISHLCTGEGLS
jgi:hypothetical protein